MAMAERLSYPLSIDNIFLLKGVQLKRYTIREVKISRHSNLADIGPKFWHTRPKTRIIINGLMLSRLKIIIFFIKKSLPYK